MSQISVRSEAWSDDDRLRGDAYRHASDGDLPSVWTPEHVMVRMVEAYEVLSRMPATIWPKSYGNAWPGMLADDTTYYDTDAQKARREELEREKPRPTLPEVTRSEEALQWPVQHLKAIPLASDALTLWAFASAIGLDMDRLLKGRADRARAARLKAGADPVKRAAAAAKWSAWAKQQLAKARYAMTPERETRIRNEAVGHMAAELMPPAHTIMPGRVLARSTLDKHRKIGAAALCKALILAKIPVR